MARLSRYFHTIRHLRPIQVAGRLQRALPKGRPGLRPAPQLRARCAPYVAPVAREPCLTGPETFRLLNVERRCARAEHWQAKDMPELWAYHLHYFDDLNAQGAEDRTPWHRDLLVRWVRENPPARRPGWDPYPLSRRLVNWVKWMLRGQVLPPECRESLAVQARWLLRRLEYHLLGNHLLANAKALVHVGAHFTGAEADRWYSRGMALIEQQLREQILCDGGHFELSPMYHAAALEDLMDLINLLRAFGRPVPDEWTGVVGRMQYWLAVMSHPDGEIAFFNDAAFGAAPALRDLDGYALRLGLPPSPALSAPIVSLDASGYVRAAVGPACLICDCGSIGPDHLPAHAHADTLSFELSLFGRRVLVNSGTSQYGADTERQRQRGTAAHNTVSVGGVDSSEVWSGFRVARRAHAHLKQAFVSSACASIGASHDGFCRLRGRNEHVRHWRLEEHSLCIEDRITGPFGIAAAYFHVHPEVGVRTTSASEAQLSLPTGELAHISFDGASSVAVQESTWHPRFGVVMPTHCLVASLGAPTLTTRLQWAS